MEYPCAVCGKRADYVSDFGTKNAFYALCSEKCLVRAFLSTKKMRKIGMFQPGNDLRVVLLTKEEMGRAGWIILHSVVSNYADKPNEKQIFRMEQFIAWFGRRYPCKLCRNHFMEMIKESPPTFAIRKGRVELQRWLSDRHNEVNVRLGKRVWQFDERAALPWYKQPMLDVVGKCKNTNEQNCEQIDDIYDVYNYGNLSENRVPGELLGQALWLFIHSMAANYPRGTRRILQNIIDDIEDFFYHSLQDVLPYADWSDTLRNERRRYIQADENPFENRDTYKRWAFTFHNVVNSKLGKPIMPYSKKISESLDNYKCIE